jgi:hypothetical protein
MPPATVPAPRAGKLLRRPLACFCSAVDTLQRRLRTRGCRSCGAVLRRRCPGLSVQLFRPEARIEPELQPQNVPARQVLLHREMPVAAPGVELHERPMHVLLERIQREEPPGDADAPFDVGRLGTVRQEVSQCLNGTIVVPGALVADPIVEARDADLHAVEEFAGIEVGGSLRQGVRDTSVRRRAPRGSARCGTSANSAKRSQGCRGPLTISAMPPDRGGGAAEARSRDQGPHQERFESPDVVAAGTTGSICNSFGTIACGAMDAHASTRARHVLERRPDPRRPLQARHSGAGMRRARRPVDPARRGAPGRGALPKEWHFGGRAACRRRALPDVPGDGPQAPHFETRTALLASAVPPGAGCSRDASATRATAGR